MAPACQNARHAAPGRRPPRRQPRERRAHPGGLHAAALEQGAEALECDVRLTADGHLVCVHDRDLRRTAHAAMSSPTMELAELSELDFARVEEPLGRPRRRGAGPRPGPRRRAHPARLLETVADYDRRVELAIETKHPTRYGGLVERSARRDAQRVRLGPRRRAGAGDELLVHRAPAGAAAGARAALVMLVEQARHWPVLRPMVARLDRRPRHRDAAPSTRRSPVGWRTAAASCTCGRSTPSPTSAVPGPRRAGRDHRPPGGTCWSSSTTSREPTRRSRSADHRSSPR